MFDDQRKRGGGNGGMPSAAAPAEKRIAEEEGYHRRVRALYKETTRSITRFHREQVRSQKMAVANMTKALERMVARTTEMIGFMIGTMLAGSEFSGKNFFANFLDLLAQFCVMLGTVAVAASKVLTALFTGNPIGLFLGGIALIAIGGVIKAFAAQLKSQGGALGSGSGMSGAVPLGGGAATGSGSLTPMEDREDGASSKTVYYYHFEGGLYDERGLARIATRAINHHAGRTAPLISREAVEGGR